MSFCHDCTFAKTRMAGVDRVERCEVPGDQRPIEPSSSSSLPGPSRAASLGIIVFLRCPKPGQVKTRLAKKVGDEWACRIYEACAAGVLRGLGRLVVNCNERKLGSATLYVFYSVAEEVEDVRHWVTRSVGSDADGSADTDDGQATRCPMSYHPQKQTGCLGERMVHALSFVEAQGHAQIGIVGTDVPDLANASVVMAGLQALGADGKKDEREVPRAEGGVRAVFGPSEDGGFYMLLLSGVGGGFFRAHGDLFRGILWSTETVMEETSEALRRAGIEVIENESVPRLRDLDEWEDVAAWMKAPGPGFGQQTRLVEVVELCRGTAERRRREARGVE